jgi:hypothetical protein
MLARRLFVGCLTLVLLSRAVHCLYVDAMLCAHAAAAQEESAPLSDPSETDPNESGCLCKGALVGDPCLLAQVDEQSRLLSVVQLGLSPASSLIALQSSGNPSVDDLLWPPPRSAQVVRALLASWQI